MDSILVSYGPLGLAVIGMFWWFQFRTNSNREKAVKAKSAIDEHVTNCSTRYEEAAKEQARVSTTLDQMSATLLKIDERTQKTHDDVTVLKARAR